MSSHEERTFSAADDGYTPTVLVVDDDPLIVSLLTGLLTSKNYSVIKSYNPSDALNVIRTKTVHLVVCDAVMPTMTGYEFMELARREIVDREVPFVFLTQVQEAEQICSRPGEGTSRRSDTRIDPQALLSMIRDAIGRQAIAEVLAKREFDAYRRRVVHTLSHEFRTPLSAINIGMELLTEHRDSLSDEKATSLLEAVRRGGLRLEKLVKDFLILQQMEAGITKEIFASHASAVSVSDVIRNFMSSRSPEYVEQGAVFSVLDRSCGVHIFVVESNILDCLDRLVSNAVKFSEGAKQVEIEAFVRKKEAFIAIKDRGCGVTPAQLELAFDVFGQVDRGVKEQQGGGFGLSIALRYAKAHEGRIEFKPREGGGSVVSLVLPVATPSQEAQSEPSKREQ